MQVSTQALAARPLTQLLQDPPCCLSRVRQLLTDAAGHTVSCAAVTYSSLSSCCVPAPASTHQQGVQAACVKVGRCCIARCACAAVEYAAEAHAHRGCQLLCCSAVAAEACDKALEPAETRCTTQLRQTRPSTSVVLLRKQSLRQALASMHRCKYGWTDSSAGMLGVLL